MSDTSYVQAVAQATGLLTLKSLLTSFLTSRARVQADGFVNEEDRAVSPLWKQLFRIVTLGFGPGLSADRLSSMSRNAAENEPFFLAVALLTALSGRGGLKECQLVRSFVIFRWLHWAAYLFALQPARGLFYYAGWGVSFMAALRLLE